MASTSIDSIRLEILQNGFWSQENAEIGKLVDDIVRINYNAQSEEGMCLCRAAAFENELVSEVIKSFFPASTLGFYRMYGRTQLTHCILNRTEDTQILVVIGLSSGSAGTVHFGSHKHFLGATEAKNGLLAIPDESLKLPGIIPHPVRMEHGGLAIVDAQNGWRIETGKWALLGFMTRDEVRFWKAMPLPATLKNTVNEMISETMDMNVKFFEA